MTPNEYQVLASRTECNQTDASKRYVIGNIADLDAGMPALLATRLNHASLGLTGEVGELCGAVERWLHYGKEFDKINVVEELGDALWYIALACNALGVSMEAVMAINIAKLKKRYPEKYSDFLAQEENRNRAAEHKVLEEGLDGKLVQSDPPITPEQFALGLLEQSGLGSYSAELPSLTDTHNRRCVACKRTPIHKSCTSGLCPDCGQDMRARLRNQDRLPTEE